MTKTAAPETVLVLQGGGALGAYQAGVYEGLAEADERPTWIAGISIGAINAALIAGNPPEHRVARLRDFWTRITAGVTVDPWLPGDRVRALFNTASAYWTAAVGVRGFFTPRIPPPSFYPAGSAEALSVYDTSPLRKTLEEFVDFDLINSGPTRLSIGAVNVRSGNFAYFDSRTKRLGPEHVMASGALPPGFPPVEIDGEHYWDGGLVSNTPLQYVLDHEHDRDLRIYQVDLFSAKGALPRNLSEAAEREKDIRFSSRTRMNTDEGLRLRRARAAFRSLLKKLPKELAADPDVTLLTELAQESAVTVVHLIYQEKPYEGGSKDFEFSRRTMLEHWAAGLADARRTMEHCGEIKERPAGGGAKTFDIHRMG